MAYRRFDTFILRQLKYDKTRRLVARAFEHYKAGLTERSAEAALL